MSLCWPGAEDALPRADKYTLQKKQDGKNNHPVCYPDSVGRGLHHGVQRSAGFGFFFGHGIVHTGSELESNTKHPGCPVATGKALTSPPTSPVTVEIQHSSLEGMRTSHQVASSF